VYLRLGWLVGGGRPGHSRREGRQALPRRDPRAEPPRRAPTAGLPRAMARCWLG